MFGLLEKDIEQIKQALQLVGGVDKAVVFGSRAIGNYKKGSDVDLAIIGKDVTSKTLFELNELLNEEYPIPYFFDLIHYDERLNEKLKEHIDQNGKEIFINESP